MVTVSGKPRMNTSVPTPACRARQRQAAGLRAQDRQIDLAVAGLDPRRAAAAVGK